MNVQRIRNGLRLVSGGLFPALLLLAAPAFAGGPPASATTRETGAASPQAARFVVQAGAFRYRTSAASRCDGLARRGLPLAVAPGRRHGGQALFLCRSAPLADHAAAQALAERVRAQAVADVIVLASAAAPAPTVRKRPPAPAEPSAVPPELRGQFAAFMTEYETRQEHESRHPAPPTPARPPARPAESGDARFEGDRIEPASLGGPWCSDLLVYAGLPPTTWTFLTPRRVRIVAPALTGAVRGRPHAREAAIEAIAGGRVRLVDDNAAEYVETTFAVERRALRGLNQRHIDKRTGAQRLTVPDSYRRCDAR